MLIVKRLIDQIKKQHVIFVNTYKSDKDNVVFVIEVHSKLIENDNDIQFNEIFAVNDSN